MNIIDKIDELRRDRNWSVNRLAMEAGLTQSTLATIISRRTTPKIDTLKNICDAFGVTLAQFFIEDEKLEAVDKREKFLLEAFRQLSDEKKQAIITLFSDRTI